MSGHRSSSGGSKGFFAVLIIIIAVCGMFAYSDSKVNTTEMKFQSDQVVKIKP